MRTDEELSEAFLKSPTWTRHRRFKPFMRRGGLRELVRSFLRNEHGVGFNDKTPYEIECATGRVAHLIQSRWSVEAGKTRARRRKRAQREKDAPKFL